MYGFNYSDADGDDSASADIENMYYTAKCMLLLVYHCVHPWVGANHPIAKKEDNPEQALKEFRAIVDKEEEKGDWYVQQRVCESLKANGMGAVQGFQSAKTINEAPVPTIKTTPGRVEDLCRASHVH